MSWIHWRLNDTAEFCNENLYCIWNICRHSPPTPIQQCRMRCIGSSKGTYCWLCTQYSNQLEQCLVHLRCWRLHRLQDQLYFNWCPRSRSLQECLDYLVVWEGHEQTFIIIICNAVLCWAGSLWTDNTTSLCPGLQYSQSKRYYIRPFPLMLHSHPSSNNSYSRQR